MARTCIAKHGGRICKEPATDKGKGVLCDLHFYLLQNGERLDIAASAGEAEKEAFDLLSKGRDTPRKSYLTTQVALGLIFTAVLYLAEIIRMKILGVPASVDMAGFDTVAAAFRNAGTVFLVAVLALFLVLLSGLVFVGIVFGAYLVSLGSVLGYRLSERGALVFAIELLSSPTRMSLLWFKLRADDHRVAKGRQILERAFPYLRQRRKEAEERFQDVQQRALRQFKANLKRVWRRVGRILAVLVSPGISTRQASRIRVSAVALVVVTTLSISAILDTIFEERIRAASADFGTERALEQSTYFLDHLPSQLTTWFDKETIEQLIAPGPEIGTLTIASRNGYSASHLQHVSGEPPAADTVGFRTEDVHYIGDFGEWAYVARLRDPSQRLLIKRNTILEFARFEVRKGVIDHTETAGALGLVDAGRLWGQHLSTFLKGVSLVGSLNGSRSAHDPHVTHNIARMKAQLHELTAEIHRLGELSERTQEMFVRHAVGSRHDDGHALQWRQTVGGRLDGMSVRLNHLEDRAALEMKTTIGAIFASIRDLAQSIHWRQSVEGRLDRMAEEIGDSNARSARNQTLALDVIMAAVDRIASSGDADLPIDEDECPAEAGPGAGIDAGTVTQASGRVAGGSSVDEHCESPLLHFLFDVQRRLTKLETLAAGAEGTVAGETDGNHEIDVEPLLTIGVPIRPVGIVSELYERYGREVFEECTSDGRAIAYVDFEEARPWPALRGHVGRASDAIGQVFETAVTKHDPAQPVVILLRGGASYTGASAANQQLSERRADWVKRQLLQGLKSRANAQTELGLRLARGDIEIVSYGVGERMTHSDASPRAVGVFVCNVKT